MTVEYPLAADRSASDTGGQPPDRAVQDRHGGDPRELDVGEAELLADRDAQHAEHQPDGEHQGEAEGGPDEDRGAALLKSFRSHRTGLNHMQCFFTGLIKKSLCVW
jgi:hypothetical protein